MIRQITSLTEFNNLKSKNINMLLKFYADWCMPCKDFAPKVEQIANNITDKVSVYSINIDQIPEIATEYQVMSIPTLILINGNKELMKQVGRAEPSIIEANILQAIN